MLSRIVPPDLGVAPKGKLLALPKRINLKTLTNNEQHRLRQLYGFGVKENGQPGDRQLRVDTKAPNSPTGCYRYGLLA